MNAPEPSRHRARLFASVALLLPAFMLLPASGSGRAQEAGRAAVEAHLKEDYPRLEALYRHLHAHPELSFQEEKTAARIASELRDAGFDVTEKVGGHGVVGLLRNGDGPVVMVRTDLDALPVKEETGLPHASQARARDDAGNDVPVMHACGHDVHMTVFIGVARTLARLRDRWRGSLLFVGQPAEERGKGAKRMLADGLFQRFPRPSACLALHVNAGMPAGTVGWVEGYALANSDQMDITFRGVGGHGAWPHATRDPIVLAAQAVLAFQTVVSRETAPGKAAVVTVGSIHGGTKHNIIPDDVKLQLTLRSYEAGVRESTIAAIRRISGGLAAAAGIPAERGPVITVEEGSRALYNDPALTRRVRGTLVEWLGEARVIGVEPVMGGEDFSEYGLTADKIPVTMLWLGTVDPEKLRESMRLKTALPSLHSSIYHPVLEPSVRTGVTAMCAAVMELAGNGP